MMNKEEIIEILANLILVHLLSYPLILILVHPPLFGVDSSTFTSSQFFAASLTLTVFFIPFYLILRWFGSISVMKEVIDE